MSARDLYSVGARLLGLYLIINGLVSLLGLGTTYEAAFNSNAAHPLGYAVVAAAQSLLFCIIGFTLFLKNRVLTTAPAAVGPTPAEFLLVGLQLMGVSFATAGLVGTLRAAADIMAVEASFTLHFTDTATSLAYVGIGLFLIFRASKVVRVIAT